MKYMLHANTPNVTYFIYTQQEQVLGELFWYVNQYPPPDDASEVQETLAYLEACSLIFERGFLSHDRIRNLDSEILQNITKGYDYFSGWLTSILKEGTVLIRYFCNYDIELLVFRSKISPYIINPTIIPLLAKYVYCIASEKKCSSQPVIVYFLLAR